MLSMPFPAYLLNSTVLNGLISFLTTFLVVYGWHLDQKMDIVNSIKFGLAEAFTNNSSFRERDTFWKEYFQKKPNF